MTATNKCNEQSTDATDMFLLFLQMFYIYLIICFDQKKGENIHIVRYFLHVSLLSMLNGFYACSFFIPV